MIESTTYLGIELLVAALLGGLSVLAVVQFVPSRVVRLTTRRLEAVIPLSMKEINAHKDVLRDDLETNIEPLKTESSSELAGREGDAINRLKTCLDALRDQLRATEEKLVLKTIATREGERALIDKESELAKLTTAFNERLALADLQKTEIVTLRMQLQTLQGRLTQACEEAKAVEDRRNVDRHEAERALSDKESELSKVTTALNERSGLADSQEAEIAALTMKVQALNEQLMQAGEEARVSDEQCKTALRVLSEKEAELARLTNALDERSVLAESQKAENTALTIQVQTLNERVTEAGQEVRALEEHRNAALRILSEKESELAMLTSALEQRSALVDAQEVENGALRTQVQALNERLVQAGKEARALEERHDVERNELKAVTHDLNEERGKFKNFHGRAVSLVQQLTAQRAEDEDLHRRAQKDLENRLIEQSRLLNEVESELTHLRGEVEVARKAEDDLRIAIIEIDGRANAANAEKAQLQAALDRAHGERARHVRELADLKRRQADQAKAAERVDNAAMPEHVKDIAAERARRSVCGRLPQIA
jgi:chromosome segregation ATPase